MLRESARTHWPWWMWETQFIEKALKRRRGIEGWSFQLGTAEKALR